MSLCSMSRKSHFNPMLKYSIPFFLFFLKWLVIPLRLKETININKKTLNQLEFP